MRIFTEKSYHSFFRISVLLKAVFSFVEIIIGFALSFLSPEAIHGIIFSLFGRELTESPKDFFWEIISRGFAGFFSTPQSVLAFIFLSHGFVKLFLLGGLWRNKLWAYPASAAVFIFFI